MAVPASPRSDFARLRRDLLGLLGRAVLVGERHVAGDRLAVVEVRDPLSLGGVEQEALGRPGDA